MKQIIIGMVISLITFTSVAKMPYTPKTFASRSIFVINPDTQEIIVDKNSDRVLPIASITKLMTAVVVLDGGQNLEETIEITDEEVEATAGSRVSKKRVLQKGTVLTRAELLHLTLMSSHNRAAAALARSYPGGMEAFVADMNTKAIEWELHDTKFVEPTGLSSQNVSSAKDLARLTYLSSYYPLIGDFSVARSFETSIYFKNKTSTIRYGTTNAFVHRNEWSVRLQKTGYIKNAGRCVVMIVEINGSSYVFVLLNSRSQQQRAADAIKIKYWLENNRLPSSKTANDLNPYKQAARRTTTKKHPTQAQLLKR